MEIEKSRDHLPLPISTNTESVSLFNPMHNYHHNHLDMIVQARTIRRHPHHLPATVVRKESRVSGLLAAWRGTAPGHEVAARLQTLALDPDQGVLKPHSSVWSTADGDGRRQDGRRPSARVSSPIPTNPRLFPRRPCGRLSPCLALGCPGLPMSAHVCCKLSFQTLRVTK